MANIKDILNSIKLAIRSKGVSVTDCDSPEVYPEKILQIKRTVSDATDTVCIHAYCSSQNTPSKPTGNPYNFSTGAITYPEGWSNPDNLSGNIWESHIVVTSNTSVQNGIVEDWTKPIKIIASYNLEDILDYDALNEEISQKIAEDYQEVYEDYQTAISELQSDVERYKNKTDTLEGEYENLAIKTTEDLNGVTRDITEQVLNSEGFTTKVTSVLNEGEYVTQTGVEQTAKSVVATALDGEINEDGELVGGRMAQLELSVDEIDSKVTNGDNYARILQRINEQDGTSEITLSADKINLDGQDTFFRTLAGNDIFAKNIAAQRVNTISNESKIVIENGEMVVCQNIYNQENDTWKWVKRMSIGYDAFRKDVAIVIYDETENPVLDLTKDSLQARDNTNVQYVQTNPARWTDIGPLTTVSDSDFNNKYIQGDIPKRKGRVPVYLAGSVILHQYHAAIYTMQVLINNEWVDHATVYLDPEDGKYKSSVSMDGLYFTTTNFNWNYWRTYLASGHYRNSIDSACTYNQLDTFTDEFDVNTYSSGELDSIRHCEFSWFESTHDTESVSITECETVDNSGTRTWSIVIDTVEDSTPTR